MVALAAGVTPSLSTNGLGKTISNLSVSLELKKSDFQAHLYSNFRVHGGGAASVDMTLASITDLRRSSQKRISLQDREGFSLLFEAPTGTRLQQDTYLIEHEQLGKFRLLMVPMVSRKRRAARYEAIINHLKP